MDIHRSRFVPYPPSAINALAFSASDDVELGKGGLFNLRLAVGRANGDIEIWNPAKGAWVQETVFHGGQNRSVEGLAWTQEPGDVDSEGKYAHGQLRLFSIGYSSTVTEWNLATGLPLRQSSGNHSEVWCLAAQPRLGLSEAKKATESGSGEYIGQNLVVGCADGTLALLSTADGDLHFQKFLSRSPSKKARALCITYKDRNTVIAGFADSCIRIYDTRSSTLVRQVTLGAGPKGGPREILCWAIRCLPNGDIVTGDSTGDVRFFEGNNYSQYQRITGHDADILDIATSRDGKVVYSVGMDRKTTVYNRPSPSKRRWAKAIHKTYHNHDIKALARYDGQNLSVVASGGLDTNLVIVPVVGFWNEYQREISSLPQLPPVGSAPNTRLVVSWWEREINIWRVKKQSAEEKENKAHKLVARIGLKGDQNITCAAISKDGQLLTVSTTAETRIFMLSQRNSIPSGGLRVRKIELSTPLPGARLIQLSPDGRWLCIIDHASETKLARVVADEKVPGGLRVLPKLIDLQRLSRESTNQDRRSALEAYSRSITRLQFSPDSKVLVASDLSGYVDSWILEGHEDTTAPEVDMPIQRDDASSDSSSEDEDDEAHALVIMGQHWVRIRSSELLPKLDSAPLILSFRPSKLKDKASEPNGNPAVHPTRRNPHPISHDIPKGPYELLVLTAHHQLYELDLLAGRLTDWSKRNPTSAMPKKFQMIRDRAMGCSWHITDTSQRWFLYGSNWLYMFDVQQDFPEEKDEQTNNNSTVDTKKRKREDDSGAGGKRHKGQIPGFDPEVRSFADSKLIRGHEKEKKARIAIGDLSDNDEVIVRLDRSLRQEGDSDDFEVASHGSKQRKRKDPISSWWSFVYRPILGMADLGETPNCLETIIIERPGYDLDLPPRLMGHHER